MGRLEDIAERNRNPKGSERLTVGIGVAVFLLIIIALMVFTDLGRPGDAPAPRDPDDAVKRVNDIKLR